MLLWDGRIRCAVVPLVFLQTDVGVAHLCTAPVCSPVHGCSSPSPPDPVRALCELQSATCNRGRKYACCHLLPLAVVYSQWGCPFTVNSEKNYCWPTEWYYIMWCNDPALSNIFFFLRLRRLSLNTRPLCHEFYHWNVDMIYVEVTDHIQTKEQFRCVVG